MTGCRIRDPYDRHRTVTVVPGDSMTQISHAEACDINFIVKRFARTGQLPPPARQPVYGDVTGLQGDLTERFEWARQLVQEAEEASLAASAGPGGSQGGTPPATEPPTGSPEPA